MKKIFLEGFHKNVSPCPTVALDIPACLHRVTAFCWLIMLDRINRTSNRQLRYFAHNIVLNLPKH